MMQDVNENKYIVFTAHEKDGKFSKAEINDKTAPEDIEDIIKTFCEKNQPTIFFHQRQESDRVPLKIQRG